jgi:hypothetical protein
MAVRDKASAAPASVMFRKNDMFSPEKNVNGNAGEPRSAGKGEYQTSGGDVEGIICHLSVVSGQWSVVSCHPRTQGPFAFNRKGCVTDSAAIT